MQVFEIQEKLSNAHLKIFTPVQLQQLLGVSPVAAQKIVERYTKKGIFVRLKRGLYMRKDEKPSQYLTANKIYQPSYISFETALSFYGLIPESVYAITSATPLPTREFTVEGVSFVFQKIKREAFSGYYLREVWGEKFLIATPEKAVVDFLYFVHLGRKSFNDRMNLKKIDFERLVEAGKAFGRPAFTDYLQYDRKRLFN